MADLSLQLDLAVSAIKEQDEAKKHHKKKKKTPKSRDSPDNIRRKNFDEELDVYFKNPLSKTGTLPRKNRTPEIYDLVQEYDDSEEDDSDSDYEEETKTRPRLLRDGSRKRQADNRFRVITGNTAPRELSVASQLEDIDIERLLCHENWGIKIDIPKYGKKKRRNLARMIKVAVIEHELATTELEEEDDDEVAEGSTAELLRSNSSMHSRGVKKEKSWPPVCLVENPAPPTDKPPRPRGSTRFTARPKSNPSIPPPPPPPSSKKKTPPSTPPRKVKSPHPHGPPKKQTSMKGGLITGMKKLNSKFPNFRATSTTRPVSLLKEQEERFLVASPVKWLIPPPPPPKFPPKDGSDDQQKQLDFELLQMFCEDLLSTAVKLEEKREEKTTIIDDLQHQIETMDDEIAGLVQPHGQNNITGVTAQLKSVTTGRVFRVERN